MTPVEDPAIVFASAQLILLYLGTAAVAFPATRHALLAKDLVTWHVVISLKTLLGESRSILDEHYPVDKWHLGDLIAWVAQSALKYRPRICELSKCLEGPLKMIVCPQESAPHTVTPCEIAVCRSTINAGSDRWSVRLVRWSSALESGFITEDDTSPVCHTQVARGRQKFSRHCL
ncbi:hypothetical protein TNCV_1759301 [Trichonephila clavipes]|nr:hypothetical protein TNCV_1759301 [Trichonephila clavipes]